MLKKEFGVLDLVVGVYVFWYVCTVLRGGLMSCSNQREALNFSECLFSLKIKSLQSFFFVVSSTELCFFSVSQQAVLPAAIRKTTQWALVVQSQTDFWGGGGGLGGGQCSERGEDWPGVSTIQMCMPL